MILITNFPNSNNLLFNATTATTTAITTNIFTIITTTKRTETTLKCYKILIIPTFLQESKSCIPVISDQTTS